MAYMITVVFLEDIGGYFLKEICSQTFKASSEKPIVMCFEKRDFY